MITDHRKNHDNQQQGHIQNVQLLGSSSSGAVPGGTRSRLGRIGLWTSALDRSPATLVRDAVAEIEDLGYGALWVGEAIRREAFANASLLLSASSSLVVATGIANIWVRDANAMSAGQHTLAEAWDGRFLLGIGVSHEPLVTPRGHRYERPLQAMRRYLDEMDKAPFDAPLPALENTLRVLGALGPRMLELSAEKADGAHPYLVPPDHSQFAREILGTGPLLCPEVAVIIEPDKAKARLVARRYLHSYLNLVNYRQNLARFGYDEGDFTDGGSDRLIDALIGWGDVETAATKVFQHLEAGADHVAVQVLSQDPAGIPLAQWRSLAEVLIR